MKWKEASTLILTALKKAPGQSKYNYELLIVKRSAQSSFMPNGYVFPGGMIEPADSNERWLDFFSSFNLDFDIMKLTGQTPPIIANKTGALPKFIALKIAAVRETFEETGILLCILKNASGISQKWATFIVDKDLNSWRRKVHNDASEFFNMCQHYNCCPDVSKLHLWSNWLTPTSTGQKRFDTAFFFSSLNKMPATSADESEIEKLSWAKPDELMNLFKNQQLWLPPPQVYEIARLLQFSDIEVLNTFAQNREIKGCERWMPIQMKTTDGSVSLLPGDEKYDLKDDSTPSKPEEIKMSNEEFRNQSQVVHRMEFYKKTRTKVVVKNYKPTHGHVLPFMISE